MAGRDFSQELFGSGSGFLGGRDFSQELFGTAPQPQAEPTPENQSVFRSIADPFLKAGEGVVMGIRMVSDAFGAGSDVSNTLKGAEQWIASLYSAQSQRDSKKVAQIIDDAKDKGVWEQVKAGFSAFAEAPIDIVAQGLGTAAPGILAALGTVIFGAPAAVTTAATLGVGALMGAGTVKGAIYDAVKQELAKTDMPADQIEARAQLAQEYGGQNLDQILMGAAIGGLSARTGLEGSAAKAAAARIAGRAAVAEAAETATRQQIARETAEVAARGPIRQAGLVGLKESGTEFLQGSQEQVAQNVALQREGFNVPTFQSAVAQGTLEALAGAPLGAGFGAREAIVARQEQARLQQINDLIAPPPQDPSLPVDEQITQLSQWYEKAVGPERAEVMALQMLALRASMEERASALGVVLPAITQAAESTDQLIGVDPARVRDLEDSLISAGVDPADARLEALITATTEAYNDWLNNQEAAKKKEGKKEEGKKEEVKPDPFRVEQLTDALVEAGVPLNEAEKLAKQQATREAKQGAKSAGKPVTPAGGEGVRVAGKPPAGPPTGGTGVTEPSGVGVPKTDVGVPAGRETVEPTTVKTVTPTPDLTGAPSVTETPQAVETKEKRPTKGAAAPAATKPSAATEPAKPAKPEKPLGVLALADKLANDAFTNLDQYKGEDRYEKLKNAVSELRFALQTELENRGVKTGAFAPTLARFDKAVAKLRDDASIKDPSLDPKKMGKRFADAAFDQRGEYAGLEDAIGSYQDNLGDTLNEYKAGRFAVDEARRAFAARVDELRKKEKPAPKLSLRNDRFAEVPKPDKLYRSEGKRRKYPGFFWSSILEYVQKYLKQGADQGKQKTFRETAELPKRTLNITTLSQASKAEKDALLADFTAWMQKNAPNVPVEDTQLYDVLTDESTDFAYPQKEDVKYLKYMGYDSVFFAEEGGETVNTWFVFDKRERAEAVEPKPKRPRGRQALPPEEREARAKARTGVRAQANRDARRLQKVAEALTTKDKDRRRDALLTLLDIVKTSQSTPRVSQARNMLKANTTEAERAELEKGYENWKNDQARIAAFEAAEREQKKATRLTPEEKKRQQEKNKARKFKGSSIYIVEDLPDGEIGLVLPVVSINAYRIEQAVEAGSSFDEAKKAAEKQAFEEATKNVEGKTEGSTFRMVDKGAYAIQKQKKRREEEAERRAIRTRQIKLKREDKINAQKQKIADLGKKLAALRQNKTVDKAELLLKEKEYKLEQLRLKVFENSPINWDADWEQGTKVRSLDDAAQEIRALQPKKTPKTPKKGTTVEDLYAIADEVAAAEETGQDSNPFENMFDKQVEEEEEEEVKEEPEAAVKPKGKEKKAEAGAAASKGKKQLTREQVEDELYELGLDPDTTKAKVMAFAKRMRAAGLIDDGDIDSLSRISKDRDMGAEDLISELQASLSTQTKPKQLTPQEQYASLVANILGAPAFDTLSKEAQKQVTDLAERNQLNLAAINRIVSEEAAPKTLSQSTSQNVEPADNRFSKFTTGAQTALHIARTASNGFHKFLARRLSQLRVLQNVKFVVLEEGQALPEDLRKSKLWPSSRGLYATRSNTIYVRGESFGVMQGINNITVLHELLHAALHKKIATGTRMMKLAKSKFFAPIADKELAKFVSELTNLANRASNYYLANVNTLDEQIVGLIEDTRRLNEDGTISFDIFTPDEFLSYGLTEPDFQYFLKQVPGEAKRVSGFSQFVRAILNYLSPTPTAATTANVSALSDLIDITDKLIGVRSVPKVQNILFAALGKSTPSALPQQVRQRANKVDATLQKVLRSHSSSPTFMDGIRELVKNRDGTLLVDILASNFTAFKGSALRQLLPTLQTETLVDWADRLGIKNLPVAWDATKGMQAMQTQMLSSASALNERQVELRRKNPDMYRLLAIVQDYSTLRRVDPTKVDLNEVDPKTQELKYKTLKTYWERLSPEAKKIYTDTRDFYRNNHSLHYQYLNDWINAYNLPGDASDASTPKGKLIASIRKMQETSKTIDPYFPLMRYGNFWVRIGKGRSGKFYMFDSQAEKELFIKTWFRDYKKTNPAADLEQLRGDNVLSDGNDIQSARKDMTQYYDVLKNLFDTIDSAKATTVVDEFGNQLSNFDRISKERLKDSIYQMVLHTLPDASFRKQFIHRLGKEGFSGDLALNFARLSTAMANQLSRLRYGPVLTSALEAAKEEIKGNPEAARLREFITEMEIRAKQDLNPSPENSLGNRMANFANQTAFLYMMSNVKTAVAQLFAIPTFAAPVLASKHGVLRTAKALGSFSAIWNSLGVRKENPDGSTSWVAPTIAQSKRVKLNPEERLAAQYMIDRGLSDTTMAYDLGNRRKVPTEVYNSTFRRGARAAVNAMTALFHHSERLIREVTFMTSFRLNRQKFPDKPFEEIARLAEKETFDALSNFSSANRPRGIGATAEREVLLNAHKPLGRAILQFKMFPAFVTTYFVRNLYRMLGKGYTKAERKEAAVQFFGTIMTSFTLAGVMGIPGFSFALGVLSGLRKVMMDDDDDDPLEKRNLELWFRNVWLPRTFGNLTIGNKPISDLLDRGVVAALTGFDMTGSLSLNNMWFPELKETATAQAAMQDYFMSMMGPFASLVVKQVPKAIDYFNQGKLVQGMEQLMPAMARSPLTAYRYATEGASTTWGAEIKPANEFTIGQIIGQGLGFSTEGLVARREDLFKANALRIEVQNQKRKLMDRLDLELREDGDVEKVIEDIAKYNTKNWFDPIKPADIRQSLRNRMERRVKSERGLELEKKYYPQFNELFNVSGRKLQSEAAK